MTKAGEKDRDRFQFQHLRIHATVLATLLFEVQFILRMPMRGLLKVLVDPCQAR